MDEKKQTIGQKFITSWDNIENFYKRDNFVHREKILEMISQMRQLGFDKTFRAGQGMYSFMLSRSKEHGLRPDQPHIIFNLTDWHYAWRHAEARSKLGVPYSFPTTIDIYLCNMNNEEKLTISDIRFTPEIDTILKQLESFPID